MKKIQLGPNESLALESNAVLSGVEVIGVQEIRADLLEFHEDVQFHNCVIHAGRIVAHKNALFNCTQIIGEVDDRYYVLKDRPFARLLARLRQLWASVRRSDDDGRE